MAEMPFVSSLVQEDLPVWQQCLDTEFLRRMEDGTLDEACFKGYIVEDSLYLREYAKVFAWGMTKARTMETLRNYYSLLGFVQESEDVTRLHYLEQFGLSEADLQALPLRPENRAYVDCMINAAKKRRGRGRMHHGLPALHAELRLDLPENAGPLPLPCGTPSTARWCRTTPVPAMRTPAAPGPPMRKRCAPACRRSAQPAAAPSSTTARCMSCISGKCRPSLARISDFSAFTAAAPLRAPRAGGGRLFCGCNLRHGFL